MLKKENSWGFDGSNNNWGRVCDSCHSTACTVYCRADSSYLCEDYDIHIHAANLVASSHECVCVCETCECAPAAFLCKADAASLCASCDADIHSVNPLARRHHRVPVMPIPGSLYGPSAVDTIGGGTLMIGGPAGESTEDYEFLSLTQDAFDMTIDEEDEDEDEAVSWLLLNPLPTTYGCSVAVYDIVCWCNIIEAQFCFLLSAFCFLLSAFCFLLSTVVIFLLEHTLFE